MRRIHHSFSLLILVFFTLAAIGSRPAAAATIHVPADQPTIQAAINVAADGDTILVAPGTYYENIDFIGKAITVASSGGPSVTTINAGAAGRGVTFNTNEGRGSVLSGFTITNGNVTVPPSMGGGIYAYAASPTIEGNVITQNIVCGSGGGIAADQSSALIQGNTITQNGEDGCSGGDGGGISVLGGSVEIIGNTIADNFWHSGNGGGIALNGPSPGTMVQNNIISGNTASGLSPASRGGGIYVVNGGGVAITQNLITGNNAGQGGDSTGGQGGGIAFFVPSGAAGPTLVNNTIANNAGAGGSGIYAGGFDSQAGLYNNLIVADPGQPALFCDGTYGQTPTAIQSNDAFSQGGNGFDGVCAGLAGTSGNISADPLFLGAAADFRLQAGSPAVEAGVNTAPGLPSTDLDGNPRIVDGNNDGTAVVDMGAYELLPTTDTVSPSSLAFGDHVVGTSSSPQNVILTNTGAQKLYAFISIDSGFGESDNCSPSVAAGASCTISVTSAPLATGAQTGNLTVHSNAAGSPQSVALTGTGIGPAASLTPTSLNFGSQPVGSPSAPQAVTLRNTGNAPLNVTSSYIIGDFYYSSGCAPAIAAGDSCTFSITFIPHVSGSRTGVFSVSDSAPGSPQQVSLSGLGVTPAVTLSPGSLAFGPQLVGTTSAPQMITLQNTGTALLNISSIAATGDFAQTNNCNATVAVGASCLISVTFAPAAAGAAFRTGSLTVSDDATGSPQSVALSGNAWTVSVTPTSLQFSPQPVGTTSAPRAVTLTNLTGSTLTISNIQIYAPFFQTNNCGTSVAAGASCTIQVTYSPTAANSVGALLFIFDSAAEGEQAINVSGTSTAPIASFSTTSLSFGGVVVGTTSLPQSLLLTNTGNGALSISNIAATGNFEETNNCGPSLAPASNCLISVTFTPSAKGSLLGTVTVTDNAAGSPQSVSLSGTGQASAGVLWPSNMGFGDQVVGTASAVQTATLSNTGNAPLLISSITATGDFAQTNNCGASLQAVTHCSISVAFTPATTGARTGVLTVVSNSPTGPLTVSLAGNGVENAPTLSPASLVFSGQVVGTKSSGQTVKVTANGPGPLVLSSISVTGPFLESDNCKGSLNPGHACNVTINFLPAAAGPAAGAVIIGDNGPGGQQMVPLSGNGLDFTLTATPASVAVNSGAQASYTVTVTALGGAFDDSVSLSCSGLPASSKCQFSPGGVTPHGGSASSTLTIQTTRQKGSSGTPSGSYPITLTGSSGGLTHMATVTLIVN